MPNINDYQRCKHCGTMSIDGKHTCGGKVAEPEKVRKNDVLHLMKGSQPGLYVTRGMLIKEGKRDI